MSDFEEEGVSWEAVLAEWTAKGWKREPCYHCSGHGVVSVYSANDFEGPGECPKCGGGATIWRTPKGRYVAYPGGPFV